MPAPRLWTVVRDEGFEAALQVLLPAWDEAERYLAAAESVLALDPEVGTPIGEGIWILPLAPIRDADVWLHYTFYETVVILLDVQMFPL